MAHVHTACRTPEEGVMPCPSRSRPVDLVHLARQTMGNKELETEVLGLFLRQARQCAERLPGADAAARRRLAHTLRGAALGVGAFEVSAACERLETRAGDRKAVSAVAAAVLEAENFIYGLSR